MLCRQKLLGDPNGVVFDWPGSTCPFGSEPAGTQPSINVGPVPVPVPHQIGGPQTGQSAVTGQGSIGQAAQNPIGTIGQGIQNTINVNPNIDIPGLQGFSRITGVLSDPVFWKKVALIGAGVLLIILGAVLFLGGHNTPAKVLV